MNVIKLVFKATGEEKYFGSYAAIFEMYNSEQIGACIGTIWNTVRNTDGRYENRLVVIERKKVYRSTSRKKKD
jgi:hypothetical protein